MKHYLNSNPTLSLSILVVAVCCLRFLFDGFSLTLFGNLVTIPHTDPLAYGALLTPVLGAHGYMQTRKNYKPLHRGKEIEDPDAN